ncbi:MAG: hypothetical protein JRJ35_18295, partial [Deltaproteobacteria bacterium]|nr:hypothetical protein [Deltaproteobacteria bacterium]
MAVRQLKDGRWTVYYRDQLTGKLKWEYFGSEGEAAARRRNKELGLQKRRLPRSRMGPTLGELAEAYIAAKNFNENSVEHLITRLAANILPELGDRDAAGLRHADLDRYVAKRRRRVKATTVRRELADIKAILNWATGRESGLIAFNPVADYPLPPRDDDIIMPPTAAETQAIL